MTEHQKKPYVSVIMAVRNEESSIENTIRKIMAQDYGSHFFEVIIADGCSSDRTKEIVKKMKEQYPNIRLLDNAGQIVAKGLNAAIRMAEGEIIVRVDGHTELAPDYVRQCVSELMRTDADNVGGKMTAIGKTLIGEAVAEATSHPFGIGNSAFHYVKDYSWADTVYLGAWRKKIFDEAGFFDESFVRNQDDEWNYRLRKKGGKILISPHIHSKYFCRNDLKSLAKQYFQYGYWKVGVMGKHPHQMSIRHFVPSTFVFGLILSAAVAMMKPETAVFFILLMGTYLLTGLLVSGLIAYKRNIKLIMALPIVFFTLHSSYGLGFCFGLVKFGVATYAKRIINK